jgi:ubiquinone/menaquinone biosynthesis C-methylase UbiE
MEQLAELKRGARATWATGDYDAMARTEGLYETGERLVARVGVRRDEDVLDVACGTGNAAVPAAQAGARVVGVDLTPEMFEDGRARATAAGVDVEWTEGDAEELRFEDQQFDVVLSTFGCMFAPRHEVVADEIARVLRPGGRLGLCNWTPEGAIGDFFRIVGSHVPPPPDFVDPPLLWGDEAHVRELFEGTGLDLEFERDEVGLRNTSVADAVELYSTKLGPVAQARQLLEADGRWPALRDDLTSLFERMNAARHGSLVCPAQYLVVVGRKQH